jgi:hypothetical protein
MRAQFSVIQDQNGEMSPFRYLIIIVSLIKFLLCKLALITLTLGIITTTEVRLGKTLNVLISRVSSSAKFWAENAF